MKQFLLFVLSIFFLSPVFAQVAQGPGIALEQAVLAGGGAMSFDGNTSVTGTIGQASAGTTSTGGGYALSSGFWHGLAPSPTAANVSVSGRVTDAAGSAIANAGVVFTGADGTAYRWRTNTFGYYTISGLEAGQTYIVTVAAKEHLFAPMAVTVNDNMTDFILVMN